jgi:hypothetical protein
MANLVLEERKRSARLEQQLSLERKQLKRKLDSLEGVLKDLVTKRRRGRRQEQAESGSGSNSGSLSLSSSCTSFHSFGKEDAKDESSGDEFGSDDVAHQREVENTLRDSDLDDGNEEELDEFENLDDKNEEGESEMEAAIYSKRKRRKLNDEIAMQDDTNPQNRRRHSHTLDKSYHNHNQKQSNRQHHHHHRRRRKRKQSMWNATTSNFLPVFGFILGALGTYLSFKSQQRA